MSESRTIVEFAKNNSETRRVVLVEYEDHRLCDIRILADYAGQGDRRPTRRGVSTKVGLICDLIAALEYAKREAMR